MRWNIKDLEAAGYVETTPGQLTKYPPVPRRDPSKVPELEPGARREAQGQDGAQAGDQRDILIRDRCRIEVVAHVSGGGRRDPDNLCPKWMVDEMVRAGVIEDDSMRFVELVTLKAVRCGRGEERTELTVFPAND